VVPEIEAYGDRAGEDPAAQPPKCMRTINGGTGMAEITMPYLILGVIAAVTMAMAIGALMTGVGKR
jgi:hypothetical protein